MSDQSMAALRVAQEVRMWRLRCRKEVFAGASLFDLLPDPHMDSARLFDVLQWQRRWGRDRARRLLRRIDASEMTEVRGLTRRQLELLKEELC